MRNLPRVSHFPQDQYSVFCAAIQILQEFFKDFYNFLTYQLHSFEDQFLRNTLLLKFFLGCHILQGFSKKNEKQGKKKCTLKKNQGMFMHNQRNHETLLRSKTINFFLTRSRWRLKRSFAKPPLPCQHPTKFSGYKSCESGV